MENLLFNIFMFVYFLILFAFVGFHFYKGRKYNKLYKMLYSKNPTEIDLELATMNQILTELSKRDKQYVIIFNSMKNKSHSLNLDIRSNKIDLPSLLVVLSASQQIVMRELVNQNTQNE